MRCVNCGGELTRSSRFCPHCSAPQPDFPAVPADTPVSETRLGPPAGEAAESVQARWAATHAFAILVFLAAAIVAFAILAVALGWLTKDVIGF